MSRVSQKGQAIAGKTKHLIGPLNPDGDSLVYDPKIIAHTLAASFKKISQTTIYSLDYQKKSGNSP